MDVYLGGVGGGKVMAMTKIHCINYQEINSKNICIHIHSQYQISNKYTKTSSSTEVYGKNFKILTADRDNDIK